MVPGELRVDGGPANAFRDLPRDRNPRVSGFGSCAACERGTIARVRKLITIALVALGISAFLHWRKRRRAEAALEAGTQSAPTDPADELRQRLAESRAEDAFETEAAAEEASVADRRAEVHEQGRAALDEMKTSDEA